MWTEDSLSQTTVLTIDICFALKTKVQSWLERDSSSSSPHPIPTSMVQLVQYCYAIYLYDPGQPGLRLRGAKVTAFSSRYSLGKFMGCPGPHSPCRVHHWGVSTPWGTGFVWNTQEGKVRTGMCVRVYVCAWKRERKRIQMTEPRRWWQAVRRGHANLETYDHSVLKGGGTQCGEHLCQGIDGNQKLFGPIPSASPLPDRWALSKPLGFANPAI